MNLDGIVPVAVPLEPGQPTLTTIPCDTHVMFWCALYPTTHASFAQGRSNRDRELLGYQDQLQRNCTLRVQLDGDPVPLMDDVRSQYGVEYWTVHEQLATGTYSIELSITHSADPHSHTHGEDKISQSGQAPPAYSLPGETLVQWDADSQSAIESKLKVVDMSPERLATETDPLWNRKDVRLPRCRESLDQLH